jgi:hypothetical protein
VVVFGSLFWWTKCYLRKLGDSVANGRETAIDCGESEVWMRVKGLLIDTGESKSHCVFLDAFGSGSRWSVFKCCHTQRHDEAPIVRNINNHFLIVARITATLVCFRD